MDPLVKPDISQELDVQSKMFLNDLSDQDPDLPVY
jgi:hypothetical protein